MKDKITTTLVRSLQPDNRPYEVRDSQLSGLILRVQPSGVMTYYLEYRRPKGKQKQRYHIGRADALTVRQARDHAEKKAAEVAMGIDIQAQKKEEQHEAKLAASRTLGGFIENHYGPWVKAERKTGDETLKRLLHCFQVWFEFPLQDITPRIVEKWRSEKLEQGRANSTLNRDITTLKSLLSKAVDWDYLDTHPLTKVKPLRTDKLPSIRYLSLEETNLLRQALQRHDSEWKAARARANAWRRQRGYAELPFDENQIYADHLTPMVLLSLNTGLRRGELFNLRWSDINFETNALTVHAAQAKSHLTRHIPLNGEARDVLRTWRTQSSDNGLVFPSKNGLPFDNVKRAWNSLLGDAGITNFRWHDMRHDFASKLVMAGIPLNTVRDLLGHANFSTTLRYAHLAPDHKAQAVEALCPSYSDMAGNHQSPV